MTNDHIYLKALRYAFDNSEFTQPELKNKINLPSTEFDKLTGEIWTETQTKNDNDQALYRIIYSAAINYLEYQELQEARQSSKTAKKLAIGAIIISSLLALSSIVISIYQLCHPATIRIEQKQVCEIATWLKSQGIIIDSPNLSIKEVK